MSMSVDVIVGPEQFQKATESGNLSVVHFYAQWAAQCPQVTDVLKELASLLDIKSSGTRFYLCDAEAQSEISLKYNVDSVPTVILFKNGAQVDRIDGANVPQITAKVKSRSLTNNAVVPTATDIPDKTVTLEERLKQLVNRHPVMVFMKGDRATPRCGFSRTLIQILNSISVEYETFDILMDEEVRQGLKEYSDWPTYPQLYVKGELIGGLDIIKEIQQSGELEATLKG